MKESNFVIIHADDSDITSIKCPECNTFISPDCAPTAGYASLGITTTGLNYDIMSETLPTNRGFIYCDYCHGLFIMDPFGVASESTEPSQNCQTVSLCDPYLNTNCSVDCSEYQIPLSHINSVLSGVFVMYGSKNPICDTQKNIILGAAPISDRIAYMCLYGIFPILPDLTGDIIRRNVYKNAMGILVNNPNSLLSTLNADIISVIISHMNFVLEGSERLKCEYQHNIAEIVDNINARKLLGSDKQSDFDLSNLVSLSCTASDGTLFYCYLKWDDMDI